MATARKTSRALKAKFDAAHRKGMAALQRHDYPALDAAIQQEVAILAEQKDVIAKHVRRSKRLVAAARTPAAGKRIQKKR